MDKKISNLKGGKKEVVVTMAAAEVQPYFDAALKKLSAEKEVPGFRKGQAPKEVILERLGRGTILELAAERAVAETMDKIVREEGWEIIDSPRIDITKLAPDNDLVFKSVAIILPAIKLGDYKKIKIAKPVLPEISDKEVNAVILDLQKMRAAETVSSEPIGTHDRAVINMDMSVNHVAIEGGAAINHSVYLDEKYYIPGLPEHLIGLKRGETKEFDLQFPENHYKKELANRLVHFKIIVNDVYTRVIPEANDALAVALGQKSLVDLKMAVKTNLLEEASQKLAQKTEIEILGKLASLSTFEEIPDELIAQETNKMLHELEDNVVREGMIFADYLTSIKKDLETIKKEFGPEAEKRIKVALILRLIKATENIAATDKEVLDEQQKQLNTYANNAETQTVIRGDEYREYLQNLLSNKKTVQFLVSEVMKN